MNPATVIDEGLFRIAEAEPEDREEIYRLRHAVYAGELHQHPENEDGRLVDVLDGFNRYLCVWRCEVLAGFVSITPPDHGRYSIDKYFARESLPFPADERLFEVRLLTVAPWARGLGTAMLLMYAALRWVEARGGKRIVAIGREEMLPLYLKAGLRARGLKAISGAVAYELIEATTEELRTGLAPHASLLARFETGTRWDLDIPFRRPAPCFHGGAFFGTIGPRFDHLDRAEDVINADVLDAWFPPSPTVVAALESRLPWLLRTSPPTDCEGLVGVVAERRGVRPVNILPGAGSSDLIFRALRHWLNPKSRVLLLDPTYGEYAHVLEQVIGCRVDRLSLQPMNQFRIDPDELGAALRREYDLVVLVNPNSPTGQHLTRATLETVLRLAPRRSRVWIDETYIDYVGTSESLERFAAGSDNVVVCKSMSKVYALSGARVAYLCAGAHLLEELRAITPPWCIGLLAQVAAVAALQDPGYYAARHAETHRLREELASALGELGWNVVPGCANFLLARLPESGPSAAALVARCAGLGLHLRDVSRLGSGLDERSIRIAVKDGPTQQRMLDILRSASRPESGKIPDNRCLSIADSFSPLTHLTLRPKTDGSASAPSPPSAP